MLEEFKLQKLKKATVKDIVAVINSNSASSLYFTLRQGLRRVRFPLDRALFSSLCGVP